MARPKKEIRWPEFDKLCEFHCTLAEIAGWFECSEDTIERAVVRDHGMGFAEYFSQKAGRGKVSLRRKQFQLAMKGDRTMLVWLGKQNLGQRDKASHELSGPGGKPIETKDVSKMTKEEIEARITELLIKRANSEKTEEK